MVCKRESINNVLNIYIREIVTGIGEKTVMWLDNKVHTHSYLQPLAWARLGQARDNGVQYIIKSNSTTALAYFDSALFKYALSKCTSFKFIQNVERANENIVRFDWRENQKERFAGC